MSTVVNLTTKPVRVYVKLTGMKGLALASNVVVTPSGNLSASDVQAAVIELQADIDTRLLSSDVVTEATANKVLRLNADSKLPASITGDADTVDGKHASDLVLVSEVVTTATANKILKLNADGKLPTDIVGNATTASDSLLLNGKSDTAFQEVAEKDQPGGYAGLDANGKIDSGWIKDASETVKGVVELATPAEVLAGTDTEKAVTPKGLSEWSKTPVGTIITYPVDSIPSHCLECNGAMISRETYSELFAVIGTLYGTGDGSTTFNLPDLRGEFIRGFDNMRGIDSGRAIGSLQSDAFKSHTHLGIPKGIVGATSDYFGGSTADYGFDLTNNTGAEGDTETRPRNVAMMYCIIYE